MIVRDLVTTCRQLTEAGRTILLVEQNLAAAMAICKRVYILNNGHIIQEMTEREMRSQPGVLHRHLGV